MFFNERQNEGRSTWEGMWGGTWKSKNHNQDILCDKTINFQLKERKERHERRTLQAKFPGIMPNPSLQSSPDEALLLLLLL